MREFVIERPRAWLVEAREKMRDLPKTNFELACDFAEQGKWHDALFRFKMTLYLQPNYPKALYNIGCCYYHLGKTDKARATFLQVLREQPGNSDAVFMLGAIDPHALSPEQRPRQMPRELVTKFFTSLAADYNRVEAQNQYRGGVAVAEQVKPLLPPSGLTVVDLGCGTGIAAIPYQGIASQMIGVDVTPAMVKEATSIAQGDKKLFTHVLEADIAQLNGEIMPRSADLVLLVNVVQFVGGLEQVLPCAAMLAKPGGIVALTLEPYTGSDAYGLVADTGRFGHNVAYVKELAARHGLVPAKQASVMLYPETKAELLVLRKEGQ